MKIILNISTDIENNYYNTDVQDDAVLVLMQGQTKQDVFLGNMKGQLKNNTDLLLPGAVSIFLTVFLKVRTRSFT